MYLFHFIFLISCFYCISQNFSQLRKKKRKNRVLHKGFYVRFTEVILGQKGKKDPPPTPTPWLLQLSGNKNLQKTDEKAKVSPQLFLEGGIAVLLTVPTPNKGSKRVQSSPFLITANSHSPVLSTAPQTVSTRDK